MEAQCEFILFIFGDMGILFTSNWSVQCRYHVLPIHLTLSKFWVYHKKNGTKVFMLKMWSLIYVKMIFNDFEIICWEILELFTAKVD